MRGTIKELNDPAGRAGFLLDSKGKYK